MALTARRRRGLIGGAKATTLNGSLAAGATSITCTSLTTWSGVNTNGPSTATINRGQTDEETISFTGISTNTLTGVSRGEAGTSDQLHTSGTIELSTSKIDADEANELVAAMANNSVRVYNDANISIPDNTLTVLTFNTERFDTGALHSTSANTSRLTCVTAGKYLITGNVQWAFNATGDRMLEVLLNGATSIAKQQVEPVSGTNLLTVQVVTTVYHLAAADYVELRVYQNSGGALNAQVAANYSPEFGMSFIGF
jgi:hypothetical protein